MNLQDYEQMQPHVVAEGIVWMTPNTHCAWRVESLLTKEPDTIAWLKTMGENDVLYDVGANMGQYSLIAASRGVRVHAFEPESQNFALLCRNIALNKQIPGQITPWSIAFCDAEDLLTTFHVQQLLPGNSCNSFGDSVDYHLRAKDYAFQQGCWGTTIDDFAGRFLLPTHIKIDVDGLEHSVLAGAKSVLPFVKSVLVETNTHLSEHRCITQFMSQFGLIPDLETADAARRKDGPFEGIGNVIYFRDPAEFLSARK